jgi:Uma2 family endonuclease
MTTKSEPTLAQPVVPARPAANGVPVDPDPMPIIAIDLPVMYEDEGQDEIGESEPHTDADHILSLSISAHLESRPEYRLFSNLNVYYHRVDRWAYVSPDLMVVKPPKPLTARLRSYRIGVHGPAPVLVVEVLSRRSFQQQDLSNKPVIYSQLGVAEYILADTTGEFLEQRLQLRRLREDGSWAEEQGANGGVTSQLGFRIAIEDDSRLRVLDAATGRRYLRPDEAQRAVDETAEARRIAEQRVKELEAELTRLRGKSTD